MSTHDDREELRRTVRRFLDRHSTEDDVRRWMEDERGFDPEVWRTMAEQLGLQGLALPEEYGGSGFGYRELCVVFEEMGATLFTGPFFATVALAANALLESGDAVAKARWLPPVAEGRLIATLALSEDAGGWDESAVATRARLAGGGWVLRGTKRYVLDAHVSDLVLVIARTTAGTSLFAVERGAAGLAVEVEPTLDQTRKLARVALHDTPAALVGTDGEAWPAVRRALRHAAVALAAEQVGGTQRLLDMTVEYATVRTQFGRAIGSFQAVKHRLADVLVELESARSAALDAARAVAERDPEVELAASVAKAFCSETYFAAAAAAVQLHGGIGFTWEHPAHLYFKRAKSSEFLLGSPRHHRELVGRVIGV